MARLLFPFTFAFAIVTAILLCVRSGTVSAQAVGTTAKADLFGTQDYPELQDALSWLRKHEYRDALMSLENAARRHPDLPSGHVMLYQLLARGNQHDAARCALEQAVRATPHDPEPYLILGTIALRDGRAAEATMDFEKAKQLLPGYNNVKRKAAMEQRTKSAIAQLAEYGQDWENAESRLRDLLTLVPDDAIGNERLARSLFWQGKARDAYETLKKATKLDRENSKNNKTSEVFPAPEAIMAQYYEEFEGLQSENPEVWFRYALKTAPNDVRTRQAVAAWALRKGKPAVAKEQAAAAAHLNKDTISDLLFGLVAMSEKNWLEAEKRFERVLTRDPSNLAVKCNLARALVEQKDATKTQRAVEYAEALWRDAPSDPDVLSTLACIYFRRGQFDRAGLALDHVLKAAAGNLNPDMATYLAHVLCRQEKWREAQEILDGILANQREFSMRSEAETLYEKVSRAVRPQTSPCLTPP